VFEIRAQMPKMTRIIDALGAVSRATSAPRASPRSVILWGAMGIRFIAAARFSCVATFPAELDEAGRSDNPTSQTC
jgi:hypothetical protein